MSRGCVLPDIPDVAFVTLEFPSGTIANVELSWLAPSKLRRTTIIGSQEDGHLRRHEQSSRCASSTPASMLPDPRHSASTSSRTGRATSSRRGSRSPNRSTSRWPTSAARYATARSCLLGQSRYRRRAHDRGRRQLARPERWPGRRYLDRRHALGEDDPPRLRRSSPRYFRETRCRPHSSSRTTSRQSEVAAYNGFRSLPATWARSASSRSYSRDLAIRRSAGRLSTRRCSERLPMYP